MTRFENIGEQGCSRSYLSWLISLSAVFSLSEFLDFSAFLAVIASFADVPTEEIALFALGGSFVLFAVFAVVALFTVTLLGAFFVFTGGLVLFVLATFFARAALFMLSILDINKSSKNIKKL